MSEQLLDKIQENATKPKRARSDSGEVEQHSLKEQIDADRYLAAKRAAASKGMGIRIGKMVPPGA